MLLKIAFRNILRNRAPLGDDHARRSRWAPWPCSLFGGFMTYMIGRLPDQR